MAKRYKHATSGALVSVRDDKVLDSEWVSLDGAKGEQARSETPDASWKVADLKAHADEKGIDLGDATKKEDIVKAIADASSSTGETAGGSDPGSNPDE
jgi:hypothetical protein